MWFVKKRPAMPQFRLRSAMTLANKRLSLATSASGYFGLALRSSYIYIFFKKNELLAVHCFLKKNWCLRLNSTKINTKLGVNLFLLFTIVIVTIKMHFFTSHAL